MNDPLAVLEQRIEYAFRDRSLLERAVTHPSFLQDNPTYPESNQRLEYLGDAVLQLVLSEALFQLYPTEREGVLSRRRAALANGAFLAALAREAGIDAALRLGASEESTGGRARASALEDACEAMFGAIYLDSDLPTTRRVILALYGDIAGRLGTLEESDNPKGRLQELVQPQHGNNALRYDVTQVSGEDHAREYAVTVYLRDRPLGSGRGTSKKLAEEAAARMALAAMNQPAQQ